MKLTSLKFIPSIFWTSPYRRTGNSLTTNATALLSGRSLQLLLILPLIMLSLWSRAQERIVDDAAITKYRSFQIETWLAQYESVFMPAVGVNHWWELGAGLVFDTGERTGFAGLMLETKFINTDYEDAGQSFGLVAGTILNNHFRSEEYYAYIPYSRLILWESSVMHVNAGVSRHAENNDDGIMEMHFIYGVRSDFGVHERFDILAGIFAENLEPGFYAGFRYHLFPDLLEIIGTYGRGFTPGMRFPGLSLQLSFIPDQLW